MNFNNKTHINGRNKIFKQYYSLFSVFENVINLDIVYAMAEFVKQINFHETMKITLRLSRFISDSALHCTTSITHCKTLPFV